MSSMKVVYIGVYRVPNDKNQPAVELANERDLTSFNMFTRGKVNEFLNFYGEVVGKNTPSGQRLALTDEKLPDAVIHTLNNGSGLCGVVITNKEYPAMVVTPLLKKITHEFSIKHTQSAINAATANSLRFPELKTYIVEYQNPQEVDKILKIQQELDATKQVLVQTMDSVLERGEKVSELVAKSNDLSASSKMFYTQAKKQNSCCVVM